MIGVVVVGHTNSATALVTAAQHVVGPQEQLVGLDILPDDDMEERRKDLLRAGRKVDAGDGVIILADMFGGTPSNLAISITKELPRCDVIAGANLPLAVKLMRIRADVDIATATTMAAEAGRKYINVASESLREPSGNKKERERDRAAAKFRLENVALMATALRAEIGHEIASCQSQRPNDSRRLALHNRYVRFLTAILDRLDLLQVEISLALSSGATPKSVDRANEQLGLLRKEVGTWWEKNRADAVDWCIRFPAIGGAIGLLNMVGATPVLATTAAIAAIGGPKLARSIRSASKSIKEA